MVGSDLVGLHQELNLIDNVFSSPRTWPCTLNTALQQERISFTKYHVETILSDDSASTRLLFPLPSSRQTAIETCHPCPSPSHLHTTTICVKLYKGTVRFDSRDCNRNIFQKFQVHQLTDTIPIIRDWIVEKLEFSELTNVEVNKSSGTALKEIFVIIFSTTSRSP